MNQKKLKKLVDELPIEVWSIIDMYWPTGFSNAEKEAYKRVLAHALANYQMRLYIEIDL